MTRRNRIATICLVGLVALLIQGTPSHAVTTSPYLSEDKDIGYNRSFFKHWIDVNKNGCDTRAEVLISEAVVKPKVDKKCKITGGKWLSAYDNKSVTNASQLDVDHLVPLTEAWRSGAWAWTPKQRQDFANDLEIKTKPSRISDSCMTAASLHRSPWRAKNLICSSYLPQDLESTSSQVRNFFSEI